MHYRNLGVPCCIGVGATVDFLAGKVSRAPAWVARTGLEWVYRMLQEPRRLVGRYWKDICFLVRQTLRESRAMAAAGTAAPESGGPVTSEMALGLEIITWQGALTAARTDQFPLPTYKSSFVVDLSGVTSVDSRGLGVMLRLIRKAWVGNVAGCFLAPSRAVLLVVEVARLDRILPLASTIDEARILIEKDAAAARLRPIAEEREGMLLFNLPQRITADVAEKFGQAVRNEWDSRPGLSGLVLDFRETTFIDSSGLGFLIRCHRLVGQRQGCELRLVHLRDNVLNVIKVARLESVLLPGGKN
jgi:N-acetylglucosaminyldiphosphoundecaprenol N-acetyl-beta-D-mannosaminyltransferase